MESVAVLGTGIMGAAMARNLAGAGIATRAWNRTLARAEPLRDHGVEVAPKAVDVAADADVVITMLSDADAVIDVMDTRMALKAMRDDAVWLQMSTIGIDGIARAAELAAERGVGIVDAPVLGTKQPAESGELIVLAAGEAESIESCRPVFTAVGSKTFELGRLGAGTRMKLVVNNWLLGLTTALAETIALAEELEVDPARFLDVIAGGPIDAGYAQLKGRMILERSFEPAFPLRLARKDAALVLEAARELPVEPEIATAAARRFADAERRGFGDDDMAAVYRAIRSDRPAQARQSST